MARQPGLDRACSLNRASGGDCGPRYFGRAATSRSESCENRRRYGRA